MILETERLILRPFTENDAADAFEYLHEPMVHCFACMKTETMEEARKRGTGSVHQVSKNVWEGRYIPTVNGKRIARNIYADSEEECEKKLEDLIKDMKAEFGIR